MLLGRKRTNNTSMVWNKNILNSTLTLILEVHSKQRNLLLLFSINADLNIVGRQRVSTHPQLHTHNFIDRSLAQRCSVWWFDSVRHLRATRHNSDVNCHKTAAEMVTLAAQYSTKTVIIAYLWSTAPSFTTNTSLATTTGSIRICVSWQ
jgi:hypothetical protein